MGRKMTKAQARKRLEEAYDKINRVCTSGLFESRADMLALFKVGGDVLRFRNKLK